MWWKNTSNDAVSKVCWGPDTLGLKVYDTQDREMLLDDNSGFIPGNECSDGLMTGQSGDWYQAYQGLKGAEASYAILQDYTGGDPVAVVFDDDTFLTYQD
ncbi:hypothetical protein GCM10025865_17560 [Paraoerskovia sediminicola]|uniref:Uncharacterized protein n=1 Tax=Paraoerskovia sediminicola TaxID=1138587 RepID=A0ABN6XBY4_9CELL|nr:hypothetical protein [Paraoerskovia sediminicola]BDZ42457.1 hypothetical protein GCM10025865_17560 [Paraoerskovia sediminicola]